MAIKLDTVNTVGRNDVLAIHPDDLVINWGANLSRGGVEPKVDDALKALALSMMPKTAEGGSSGQINPILVRITAERKAEVVGGFRRARAAKWLVESGQCPDFRLKCIVSKVSAVEAALANLDENMHREDPQPIQIAYAIRSLMEDYYMDRKSIAERLKVSIGYIGQLLTLVELPKQIQDSVDKGETTVTGALAIAKLPAAIQVETFQEVKAKGKVKAKDVAATAQRKRDEQIDARVAQAERDGARAAKDIIAADREAAPTIKAKGRSLNDLAMFLQEREKNSLGTSQGVAALLLDFIQGETTKAQAKSEWVKLFPGS